MGWTDVEIATAKAMLGESSTTHEAARKLSVKLEREVSESAVKHAFKHRGLGPLAQYLGKPKYTGASVVGLDDFDDPDRPNVPTNTLPGVPVFDTQPAPPPANDEEAPAIPDGESLRVFVLPDIHSPYHDERALDTALLGGRVWLEQVPSSRRVILIQGDAQDNFRLSFHDRSPDRGKRFSEEVKVTNGVLDMIQSLDADRVVFTEGNHEARLKRFLVRHAPEFLDMLSMSELLKINQRRGWEWHAFKEHAFIGDTLCTHELGFVGRYALSHTGNAAACSTLTGHTHRIGLHEHADVFGNPRFSASFGWLGRLEDIDYMYRAVATREWAHGFGTGIVDDTGRLYTWPHRIHDGRTHVDGKLVAA